MADPVDHANGASGDELEAGLAPSPEDVPDGGLPPDGGDQGEVLPDPADSDEEQRSEGPLAKWGPVRRFRRYRDLRGEERAKYYYERDEEKNESGKLPDGETIQVPAVWIAELYTPSHLNGLLEGIAALGWEHGRSDDASLLKWMSDARQGYLAGWVTLGLITPPKDRHFMSDRTAHLPTGVKAAVPILMSITPSVTALVMLFALDDDAANALDAPLRARYRTRFKPSRLFRRRHVLPYILFNSQIRLMQHILDPHAQRRAATRTRLTELENACVDWVRRHLPGVFASGLRGGATPTAILVVTEESVPGSEEARTGRALDAVAIDRDYDAWGSEDWPNGRLFLPRSWDEEGLRLTFACRRSDGFPDDGTYTEPTSNWTLAYRANMQVRGLLSRWALTCLLDGYHQRLADLRDRSAGPQRYRPVRDLKHLRSLARTELYDIVTSASEIARLVDDDDRYLYDIMEPKRVGSYSGEPADLVNGLRSSQRARAKKVHSEADLLQSVLSVSSDVSQTITNIRIQRVLVCLTIVGVGLALAALLQTLGR